MNSVLANLLRERKLRMRADRRLIRKEIEVAEYDLWYGINSGAGYVDP